MSNRYRGRIPYVDPSNPQAFGRDDKTGLPVMHHDLVKQMEFIGNSLAWTGLMVHYKDVDQPNPQRIPPRFRPDPVPIPNPRLLTLTQAPLIPSKGLDPITRSVLPGLTITGTTSTSITVAWDFVENVQAYVVGWDSLHVKGETRGIIPLTYTITGLSPGNTYNVRVASTADNSTPYKSQFSTSGFSMPVQTTLPLS
jgi:hypothetical protein